MLIADCKPVCDSVAVALPVLFIAARFALFWAILLPESLLAAWLLDAIAVIFSPSIETLFKPFWVMLLPELLFAAWPLIAVAALFVLFASSAPSLPVTLIVLLLPWVKELLAFLSAS